jgi:predicted transposase YbfD/YdcC
MPRQTQAQRLQQQNEEQALAFFEAALAQLSDPRRAQGTRYPLRSVIVIALMAMVCGADDAEAMQLWGETHENWLREFLQLPHGAPTQDVFLSVFAALDPAGFSAVFRAWADLLTLRLALQQKHIAIDGKTSRRSFDRANERPAIHTVSAWLSQAGLVLGQCKTGEKSNEIKAIPQLLETLDLRGATVTVDAMGCQREIAGVTVDGGGDYILSVKDNQPTLRQDIETTFRQARDERLRSVDELDRPHLEVFETLDKAHGRIEKRTVSLCRNLDWLSSAEQWRALSFVVEVQRERTVVSTNATSLETAYYIGSESQNRATAETAATKIRDHWGIETKLHWVLDVAFREDDARHRARNTAQNMTTLRHFALNVLKQDSSRKLGVANSRKRAGWDRSYLLQLLTGPIS